MKGNPRSSGYERDNNDWYVEPMAATHALFGVETFVGSIHDPACGGGNIPSVAMARGYPATGADIVDRGCGARAQDFLFDDGTYDNIITNPPFKEATEFARRGLRQLASDQGTVAILQRLSWLEGRSRYERLFSHGHLHALHVFSNRISMPPGGSDVPATGGSVAYAWFVFRRWPVANFRMGWITG